MPGAFLCLPSSVDRVCADLGQTKFIQTLVNAHIFASFDLGHQWHLQTYREWKSKPFCRAFKSPAQASIRHCDADPDLGEGI